MLPPYRVRIVYRVSVRSLGWFYERTNGTNGVSEEAPTLPHLRLAPIRRTAGKRRTAGYKQRSRHDCYLAQLTARKSPEYNSRQVAINERARFTSPRTCQASLSIDSRGDVADAPVLSDTHMGGFDPACARISFGEIAENV